MSSVAGPQGAPSAPPGANFGVSSGTPSAAPAAPAAPAAEGVNFGNLPSMTPAATPAATPGARAVPPPGANFGVAPETPPAPATPPAGTPPAGTPPPAAPPAPTPPAAVPPNFLAPQLDPLAPQAPQLDPLAPQTPPAPPAALTGEWGQVVASHPDPAVRELMTQKAYNGAHAVMTAYYNANRFISGAKDVIAVPAENAPAAVKEEFLNRLGRPATPAGYDFRELAKIPGAQPDAKTVEFGRTFFHALGVPQDRVNTGLRMWEQFVAQVKNDVKAGNDQASEAENARQLEETRKNWNGDFNADMEKGKKIVQALGLNNDHLRMFESAAGSAPIAWLFGLLGQRLSGEAEFNFDANGGAPLGLTPAQEISKLQADPAFQAEYNDPRHPNHAAALARMDNLYRAQRQLQPART